MKGQRGFTLIELLIALAVFAVVSTAGVAILRVSIGGQEAISERLDLLTELERFRTIFREDVVTATARSYRLDPNRPRVQAILGGRTAQSELGVRDEDQILLALVRTGWTNPQARAPRSTLQRVEWRVRDDQLIRRSFPYLDTTGQTPFTERVLLASVSNVAISFARGTTWSDDFRGGDFEAVAISYTHPTLGPVRQVFAGSGLP